MKCFTKHFLNYNKSKLCLVIIEFILYCGYWCELLVNSIVILFALIYHITYYQNINFTRNIKYCKNLNITNNSYTRYAIYIQYIGRPQIAWERGEKEEYNIYIRGI